MSSLVLVVGCSCLEYSLSNISVVLASFSVYVWLAMQALRYAGHEPNKQIVSSAS